MQVLTETFAHLYNDNLFLSHYYFIGQFLFLCAFYTSVIKSERLKKVILSTSIFVIISVVLLFYFDRSSYNKFSLIEVIITSLPLVIFSIFFFVESIEKSKKFIYINSGIFIYLASTTFLFAAGNYINSSNSELRKIIWDLHAFIYVIYQILIFIEWYKHFRKKKIVV
tara:strand:+ start:68745 stop:69248 length:504 start_codon:yes stop_codon:yes gene_type:complete